MNCLLSFIYHFAFIMALRGRPVAPVEISKNILARNQLSLIDLTPREMYAAMGTKLQLLQWLAQHRVIRNSMECNVCHENMNLIARHDSQDAYSWHCRNCRTRSSVKSNSFLSNCHLSTEQVVMFIFYWCHNLQLKHIMQFEGICNWDVAVNYANFLRLECRRWFDRQVIELGGFDDDGESIVVEMDESFFFRRKYHRGRFRPGTWVVGIIERNSNRCWLQEVNNRNAATLEDIIIHHILPGSTIITDAWRGYFNVGNINNGVYRHHVVVHEHAFVDPNDNSIHTQTIEGMWAHAKKKLRYQHGTSRGLFPSYLMEFAWRYAHKQHVFGDFMGLLCDNYDI